MRGEVRREERRGEVRGEERDERWEERGEEERGGERLRSAVHRGERREEQQQQERREEESSGSVTHSGSFSISLAFSMTSGSLKEASISPIFSGLAANASHSCRRERAGARTHGTRESVRARGEHTIEREREGSVR